MQKQTEKFWLLFPRKTNIRTINCYLCTLILILAITMKYPIGIQTFEEIITEGYVYIDKTESVYKLLQGKVYFLSRPRRFGKSLLLSTLASLFEGRKDLFKGLFIEDKIEWKSYIIVRISLNGVSRKEVDLHISLLDMIREYAQKYQIILENHSLSDRFRELVRKLSEKEKVVLLIDEYDKPLISFIEDSETYEKNRAILKEFYGTIKDLDPYLRFVFITGVSRFSKVSLFSDLNSLKDISMNENFCDICGYTETDMHHYFTKQIGEIAAKKGISKEQLFAKVKQKYNGYNFYGTKKMYNPWSVLNFLDTGHLDNFWFETGTPTFLTQLIARFQTTVQGVTADKTDLGKLTFDSENIIPLLYQTGYLTIDEDLGDDLFTLRHPNEEVSESFTRYLLAEYTRLYKGGVRYIALQVRNALKTKDAAQLISAINPIFASIPYQIFNKDKEAYYHSVMHLVFMLLHYNIESEVCTNVGRVDTVLLEQNEVWLFEFKLDSSAEVAFAQIIDKNYAQKYRNTGKTIYGVGVNFDSEIKKINEVKIQAL